MIHSPSHRFGARHRRPLGWLLAAWAAAGCLGCGGETTLYRAVERGDLPAGGKTYGGTLLDVDGDGWLDLLLSVHTNEAQVFLGRPGLRFQRYLAPQPLPPAPDHHGAAACDYDNDGDWDAAVTLGAGHGRGLGRNTLWEHEGPGRFRDAAAGQFAFEDPVGRGRGALWGDFDGDRQPEILLMNYASAARLLTRDGAAWRDVTDWLPRPRPVVLWSPGRPAPTKAARRRSTWVHSAVADDLDGDADTDLLILSNGGWCSLWLNAGNGRFWDATARSGIKPALWPHPPKHAASGDLDGDGDLDLVFLHRAVDASVRPQRRPLEWWRNDEQDGRRHFTPTVPQPALASTSDPLAVLVADLDNDGHLDLYVVHTTVADADGPANRLYRGDGAGNFTDTTVAWGGTGPAGSRPESAWAVDLDRDGDLDLITFNGGEESQGASGGVLCYENRSRKLRGLTVELVSPAGPPHGLGAKLELQVGGRRLVRTASCVGNPINAAILPVHFGLGTDPGPYVLTISWPSGRREQVTLAAPGGAYRVREGAAAAVVLPAHGKERR